MLLQDFSGGLNTRVAPNLLQPNEAQIYTNIDNASGSIVPIKGDTLVGAMDTYFTYYYAQGEFVSSSVETSYAEYREVLYSAEHTTYPKKYDGTNTYKLGIQAPTFTAVPTAGSAGNLDGVYVYAFTYYNSATDIESAPIATVEVTATNQQVSIVGIAPSTDPQVDTIRVYRLGGAVTDSTLIYDLPNTAVGYTDNNADIDIAGNKILDSIDNLPAPITLKYLVTSYAMLFGAVGDKLYYSKIGKPDYWPATFFIDFESEITGIGLIPTGVLVFTKFKTYIVVGNSPETFTKYLVSAEQGCENHYSIQYTNNTLIWVSQDGICASTGGEIQILTMAKLGKTTFPGIKNAQVLDRVYYLVYDNGIIAYDFRFNQAIRPMSITGDWLGSYKDSLYIVRDSNMYEMFTGEALEYHYKSPMLTEGMYTNLKVFKDFYIKYNGDMTLKLYIDGNLVNTKELTGDSCFDLKALSSANGYGLEIEIIGTATISEIEYKAFGRQNGR